MIQQYLDFEKPIFELESKIEELKKFSSSGAMNIDEEIKKLSVKLEKLKKDIFSNLSRWQITQFSRHPNRPYTLDYIKLIFDDFIELHGDRNFMDDRAIVGGLANFKGQSVVIVGHQKGRSTVEKLERNFGMPNPEGYRKALRLFNLAERYRKPVITFVDTPGAYPGLGAEERGQAEAIAKNLRAMSALKVPIIVVVIGEGGSGGALALGVGDKILMLEFAIYSVISPEGCAAILWNDGTRGKEAADSLKVASYDLLKLKVVDEVIKEPLGGAHRDINLMADNIKDAIEKNINELLLLSEDELLKRRYEKYRNMGVFYE